MSFVLNPSALDQIMADPTFKAFLRSVSFHSLSRPIRYVSCEQFYAIATRATGNPLILLYFIIFLFELVQTSVREMPQHSKDVFHLLCNLLRYANMHKVSIPKHEQLLGLQLEWLREVKVTTNRRKSYSLMPHIIDFFWNTQLIISLF